MSLFLPARLTVAFHEWLAPPSVVAVTEGQRTWLAFAIGVLVGMAIAWQLWRMRDRRRVQRIADAIELLGDRATEEEFGRLQDSLGSPWDRLAAAGRKAFRKIAARDRDAAIRLQDLEAILYSTTSGFIAIDPRHRVLDINPAAGRWLGSSPGAARGRLIQEVARQPELNRFLDDALRAGASIERNLQLSGPTSLLLRATAEPLRDASGRTVGLLVSLQDVTRIHRLETLRSEFVANVSHELRTPITSIKGYVETLLQVGSDDPAQVRKFLEIVQRNASRLSNLVEDLLALASLEQAPSNDDDLKTEPLSAAGIAHRVSELLGPTADARRIRLVLELDERVQVLANATLAEQALLNLVSNAIRYSAEATTVTIGVRKVGGMGELSVSDQGPGIAPKHLDRIFERFYRVDKGRSSSAGGTGLGLAIVKHIAQALDGRVDVESELGRGSRFAILLPIPPTSNTSFTKP